MDEPVVSAEHEAAARRELDRILSSQSFRGSRRCCRLLEYSADHVLKGNAHEELRERNIGVEVFGRPPDYDTAEDAIVRVTANEVRKRLAQYYQGTDSRADPVISLPPGSYAVAFRWKQAAGVEAPPPPAPRKVLPNPVLVGVAAVALLAGSAAVIYAARAASSTGADPAWSGLFNVHQKTNIVMADAARYEIQELLRTDLTLEDYLKPEYPANLLRTATPEMERVIRFMGTRQTTSVGSATLGSRLLEFARRGGGTGVLRHPRHLHVREFQTDNFILLGSRMSVPWVELFEPGLNYSLRIDPDTHQFYLENRSPRPGEPSRYRRSPAGDETYADVAVVPNIDRTGTVLILDGIDMLGVEGAGEFVMGGALSSALGAAPGGRAYAEILLRVRSIGGAASKSEIVAVRETRPAKPAPLQ